MARHINQRALTVNTARINLNPQPAPPQAVSRPPNLEADLEDVDLEAPSHLDLGFHLILTGYARAGGGW